VTFELAIAVFTIWLWFLRLRRFGRAHDVAFRLAITDASGNPSGFTAMLYDHIFGGPFPDPGSSLVTLNGSLNPVTGGIFTYTPASNFTLSRSTIYYIVLTAETAVANGAYDWSYVGANSYNPSGDWVDFVDVSTSSDASSWNRTGDYVNLP
jgi:hypothetical protein